MVKIAEKKCGLCGKKGKLTKTKCCDEWICDDTENYVMFSYAKSSCYRNHDRYTLCAFHYNEGHKGKWQDCKKCKKDFKGEEYAYFTTNEFNFEPLEDVPEFEPTYCSKCNKQINIGYDPHSMTPSSNEYVCAKCFSF